MYGTKEKKRKTKLKLFYFALQSGNSGTYCSKDHTSQNPQKNILWGIFMSKMGDNRSDPFILQSFIGLNLE